MPYVIVTPHIGPKVDIWETSRTQEGGYEMLFAIQKEKPYPVDSSAIKKTPFVDETSQYPNVTHSWFYSELMKCSNFRNHL
jgi:hypothetical protein